MADFYYDRQDLRHGTNIAEFDHEDVDPRTYYRRLKRDIQEVATGNGYKYATQEPDGENPVVNAENVGGRSGRVQGRLIARTNWERFAGSETEVESSPVGAIIAAIIGVIITLVGFTMRGTEQGLVIGLGLLVLVVAGILYYLNEPGVKRNEYYFRKRARILMKGEVAEHDDGDLDPTDIVASDLSVVCSEDLELEYRDASGRHAVSRDELPPDARGRLDTGYTPLTDEVDFQTETTDTYCYRVS